jgi:hypothetical protein
MVRTETQKGKPKKSQKTRNPKKKEGRELVPLMVGRQKTKKKKPQPISAYKGYTPDHSPGPLNCEILCDGLPYRHATKCSSVQQALWLLPSMLPQVCNHLSYHHHYCGMGVGKICLLETTKA